MYFYYRGAKCNILLSMKNGNTQFNISDFGINHYFCTLLLLYNLLWHQQQICATASSLR